MEKRSLPIEIQEKLLYQNWVIENGIFIKRNKSRSSLKCIYLIDENKDKLTENFYAYLNYLFVGKNDTIEAYGSKFYDSYQDFQNLYFDSTINKSQIIKECIEAVLELWNIGVNYTDIHSKNIIVNSESHMRLVDLDETSLVGLCDKIMTFKFIDLMLESILFYDVRPSIWYWVTPRLALIELENKKVLSSSFIDSIEEKKDFDSFNSNIDKYLQELCDEEKSFVLRKELKNKYPKWFVR